MNNMVIKYGNRWLQSDEHLTHPEWVDDLALATLHSAKWAAGFVNRERKAKRSVDAMSFDVALVDARRASHSACRSRWFACFEEQLRARYKPTWTSDGFWVNAHMLFNQGFTVENAIFSIAENLKLKPIKVAVTCPGHDANTDCEIDPDNPCDACNAKEDAK